MDWWILWWHRWDVLWDWHIMVGVYVTLELVAGLLEVLNLMLGFHYALMDGLVCGP